MNSSKYIYILLWFQRRQIDWEVLGLSGLHHTDNIPIPIEDIDVDLGLKVNCMLKFHQHIGSIVNKTGGTTQNILKQQLIVTLQ